MIIAISSNEAMSNLEEIKESGAVMWNFSSYNEYIPRVNILPPFDRISYADNKSFDYEFYNYLFTSDSIFFELFSKILFPLYMGQDVYLLVKRDDDIFDSLIESLFKIIQERYDYNGCVMVNLYEDLEYVNRSTDVFSARGILVFDNDKERWTKIQVALNGVPRGE